MGEPGRTKSYNRAAIYRPNGTACRSGRLFMESGLIAHRVLNIYGMKLGGTELAHNVAHSLPAERISIDSYRAGG